MRPLIALVLLTGCASIAISAAPKKRANPVQSPESKAANDVFWDVFHRAAYAEIPRAKEALQLVYLQDPTDALTAAHLGFLHIWAIAERARAPELMPSITDQMLLSQRYFAEAVEMTQDPRYLGFLASAELAIGVIHKDERMLRTGYFRMNDAVDGYPEFNLFSRGYGMSSFPPEHDFFKAGVEDMWRDVEICFGAKLDRGNPDYTPFMKLETTTGEKRVCWNGWMAPHNHEGFALNMGDMLVKQGDVKAARRFYENAKLSRTYAQWPFRTVLEQRIAQADENVALFRQKPEDVPKDRRMMFASEMSCSGCHAD